MAKLDADTLEEIRKFEELAAEFESSVVTPSQTKSETLPALDSLPSPVDPLNLTSTDDSVSSDPPFRENLI